MILTLDFTLDFTWPRCICSSAAACPIHDVQVLVIGSTDDAAVEAIYGFCPTSPGWSPAIDPGTVGWRYALEPVT